MELALAGFSVDRICNPNGGSPTTGEHPVPRRDLLQNLVCSLT